ncbi:MAG: hypothetical protein M0Z47_05490, partial [Actinomycetota bacterium]|nr:hypothetical protein [Actinomycetota bacterium]
SVTIPILTGVLLAGAAVVVADEEAGLEEPHAAATNVRLAKPAMTPSLRERENTSIPLIFER